MYVLVLESSSPFGLFNGCNTLTMSPRHLKKKGRNRSEWCQQYCTLKKQADKYSLHKYPSIKNERPSYSYFSNRFSKRSCHIPSRSSQPPTHTTHRLAIAISNRYIYIYLFSDCRDVSSSSYTKTVYCMSSTRHRIRPPPTPARATMPQNKQKISSLAVHTRPRAAHHL